MTKEINTLVYDIYEVAYTGLPPSEQTEESDKIIVDYATRMGEFMGKKVYPDERKTKDHADRTIRMSELGTPCLRQLMYKWYEPEFGLPPYTYQGDPTLGVKFGYGNLIEEYVLTLAELAGHLVTNKQTKVEIPVGGWIARGSMDAVIDNVLVDVKSSSKFGFDVHRKEGFTEKNDTFGYSYQLNGYRVAAGYTDAAFLMVEKETGRLNVVPPIAMDPLKIRTRIGNVAGIAESYQRTGKMPARLKTKPHSYGEQLDIACSYCQFKHACFPDLITYVERGRPIHITNLNGSGVSFAKIKASEIWKRPAQKVPKAP